MTAVLALRLIRRRALRPLVLLGAFAAMLAAAGAASADEINPDRPDFVESSAVVGTGRIQLETSLADERDRADGLRLRTASTPTLLRVGVSNTLELRVESDGWLHTRATDDATGLTIRDHGWADTSIGLKWHWRDGAGGGAPSMGWLLDADLDSGSAPYRGQGVRPSLRFVAEWDLPDDWSLGVMPGVFVDRRDDGTRYRGGIAAVTLGRGLGDRMHGFVEIAGQRLARQADGGSVVTFDTGLAYLLADSLQIDAAMFFGLNRDAPDFAWTVGVSIRF